MKNLLYKSEETFKKLCLYLILWKAIIRKKKVFHKLSMKSKFLLPHNNWKMDNCPKLLYAKLSIFIKYWKMNWCIMWLKNFQINIKKNSKVELVKKLRNVCKIYQRNKMKKNQLLNNSNQLWWNSLPERFKMESLIKTRISYNLLQPELISGQKDTLMTKFKH